MYYAVNTSIVIEHSNTDTINLDYRRRDFENDRVIKQIGHRICSDLHHNIGSTMVMYYSDQSCIDCVYTYV